VQNELDIVRDVSARLAGAGIGYMLTGSMAMNYYVKNLVSTGLRPRLHRTVDAGT